MPLPSYCLSEFRTDNIFSSKVLIAGLGERFLHGSPLMIKLIKLINVHVYSPDGGDKAWGSSLLVQDWWGRRAVCLLRIYRHQLLGPPGSHLGHFPGTASHGRWAASWWQALCEDWPHWLPGTCEYQLFQPVINKLPFLHYLSLFAVSVNTVCLFWIFLKHNCYKKISS